MALFGKLFEKKNCSICGGDIGLLGNRKLEDGNLCKECAGKLSPFMDDRRHTTVDGIQAHLNYRSENLAAVAAFHPTRTITGNYTLMIDEAAGNFILTRSKNWRDENPDVIPLSAVTEVRAEPTSSRTELKQTRKTPDGKTEQVSYNPPRYKYHYTFYLTIRMNEDFPWFSRIYVQLNNGEISIDTGELHPMAGGLRRPGISLMNHEPDPHINPKYCAAEQMGQEICEALLRRNVPTAAAAASSADPRRVVCDFCGTSFVLGDAFECPACGAPVK
ncbi:MAG: DUF4428 domain-containing protein [Oscillospiraceae bacterium]|nr:DUF4428 domain-containing protein [Oscillospiraceae bacterium]